MICVIGSSGFLGSHLVSHFESIGQEVVSLSIRNADPIQVHDEIQALLKKGVLKAVLLCGAAQEKTDDLSATSNLVGSNVLLPALLGSALCRLSPNTKIVHFGSSWQSGAGGRERPYNLYAATKSAAENILDHFAASGLPAVSLRLCDTYGPADSRGKLLNLALKTIASRSRLDTTSGEQPLKLVHIHDVTRAVELALELPPSPDGQLEIYDVAPLHAATVREVLGYICKLAGVEPSSHFNFGSLPYHPREFHNEVAYKMLPNWSPKISLEDGLREVWEATQSN